jgi:endonuclease/exonuclease/phosphatase family metal-dependent hydrolase
MKRSLKILRISLKVLLIIVIVVVAGLAGFLIYSTVTDYSPKAVEVIDTGKEAQKIPVFSTDFSLISWNIGYCGLGKDMDFFYDGGSRTSPTEESFQASLNGVYNFLADHDSLDFILVQEVDISASRSYNTDQSALLKEALPTHTAALALNYNVDFVPLPVTRPMQDVTSGMMSFSRFPPVSAERYAFPVGYPWPTGVFMLDRCFLLERFKLAGGREIVLINTHNSPYGDAAEMRDYELWMLRGFMLAEYEKGNYVIAGGDWNICPPGYDTLKYYSGYNHLQDAGMIAAEMFPSSWNWAYDPKVPSNRNVNEPYRPGVTPTSTIDFFVTSPNLKVREVHVIPTGFEFSDHQPVYLKVSLIENPMELCPEACSETIQLLLDSLMVLNNKPQGGHSGVVQEDTPPDRFYQRK